MSYKTSIVLKQGSKGLHIVEERLSQSGDGVKREQSVIIKYTQEGKVQSPLDCR